MRFAIVVSKFNQSVTDALLAGALKTLKQKGVQEKNIDVFKVPGAFEIPVAADRLAKSKKYDAILTLGCVLKGETAHNNYISSSVAWGIQYSALNTNVPIAFGVLTPDNLTQAKARAGNNSANKGTEAAEAAWEMAHLFKNKKI